LQGLAASGSQQAPAPPRPRVAQSGSAAHRQADADPAEGVN